MILAQFVVLFYEKNCCIQLHHVCKLYSKHSSQNHVCFFRFRRTTYKCQKKKEETNLTKEIHGLQDWKHVFVPCWNPRDKIYNFCSWPVVGLSDIPDCSNHEEFLLHPLFKRSFFSQSPHNLYEDYFLTQSPCFSLHVPWSVHICLLFLHCKT